MPEPSETQHGNGQALLSRRQILTGTSIGIGATLLFHRAARNRVDLPAPRPQASLPPAADAADRSAGDAIDVPPGTADLPPGTAEAEPATVVAESTDELVGESGLVPTSGAPGRATVHRTQLSDHGQPQGVARGDRGVLVVGMSPDGAPLCWLTEDGTQWIEHTLDTPGGQTAEVWGVAAFGDGYVAVGTTIERTTRRIAESGIVPGDDTQVTFIEQRHMPTVWQTADCVRWPGQSIEEIIGPRADLIAVAWDGARLVAVGGVLDHDGAQATHGLMLTSTDGSTWRRVDLGADAALIEGTFTSVAVGSDGWYATSVDLEGGAVWRSDDGLRWSVIDGAREAFRGMSPQGIGVQSGRLLVAAAGLFDPRPRYFVSHTGGRTWRRATFDVAMLAGPDSLVTDLAVIAGDVVVVGTHRGAPVLEGGTLYAGD